MKLLFAGNFFYPHYEEACARGFEHAGAEVIRFPWHQYFPKSKIGRAQWKFMAGPSLEWTNYQLIRAARKHRPDVVAIWLGNVIYPQTIDRIKRETGALVVSYHQDDPFGLSQHTRKWVHFHPSIPKYDICFVVRRQNLIDYKNAGAKAVHYSAMYYIPELHRPLELTPEEQERFGCDVVFIGHYEQDGRTEYLADLVEAGFNLHLHGEVWKKPDYLGRIPASYFPIQPVFGDDYAKALCGADMALCFLSKLNRDSYTTRVFEIPACGRLLLSERSDYLCELFHEDEEAVFFSSREEMIEKARALKADPERAKRIAEAGRTRVLQDGHDVYSRMKNNYRIIEQALAER